MTTPAQAAAFEAASLSGLSFMGTQGLDFGFRILLRPDVEASFTGLVPGVPLGTKSVTWGQRD